MIHLLKTRDGQRPEIVTTYPYNWDMKDAMQKFTDNYKKELCERSNVTYITTLEDELNSLNVGLDPAEDAEQIKNNKKYVDNIDFRGPGYYSIDGDCLLLDGELKETIWEDVYAWELVEVPEPEE